MGVLYKAEDTRLGRVVADSEPEHRKSLIHRWESRLERKDALSVKGNWPAVALISEYDFDRIAAYLYQEKRNPPEAGAAMAAVSREYEKGRIHNDGSYMQLHYSLRALSVSRGLEIKRREIESRLRTVSGFLIKTARKEPDDPLFTAINSIHRAIASASQRKEKTAPTPSRSSRVRRWALGQATTAFSGLILPVGLRRTVVILLCFQPRGSETGLESSKRASGPSPKFCFSRHSTVSPK